MGYTTMLEKSIMQKGKSATTSSKMLENFISPIDAFVVERLESAGVVILGRADMDEFGLCGLFGGGAGGVGDDVVCAIDSVINGKVDFALCNDYTGAVSRIAGEFGAYYIHPTYGTVSRYGLIPAVGSMDQIGVICKSPKVGFEALRIIAGYDAKDGVMSPDGAARVIKEKSKSLDGSLQCIEFEDWIASNARNDGGTDFSNIYTQLMQILCCAELSTNISRYDGIKFGHRSKEYNGLNELYTKSRTEAFGEDVKLAAILGAMVLSQENYNRYYDKAMRLRRLIKDSLEFDKYDVIVTRCSVLSRLCGLPSLTTPEKVYIADVGREDILESVLLDTKGDNIATKGTSNATEGGGA